MKRFLFLTLLAVVSFTFISCSSVNKEPTAMVDGVEAASNFYGPGLVTEKIESIDDMDFYNDTDFTPGSASI